MKKTRKKETVYRSMEQFEKAFVPESFKRTLTRALDLQALAASMAEEVLQTATREMVK